MLSAAATKLLAWFSRYNITASAYSYNITVRHPRAQRRGAFSAALAELVAEGY